MSAASTDGQGFDAYALRVPEVDFVINCYERTYRDVLAPGFIQAAVEQQRFGFTAVTVLLNNVDDLDQALRMVKTLVDMGEITRYAVVADELAVALAKTDLRERHLRRLPHFTDCCLVAVTLEGPDWLAYWDADAVLEEPGDWVTPVLAFMAANPEVAIGNPNNWHQGLAEREALRVEGDMAIGYGFSDVAFLARRSELAGPIYRKIAPASWRFPLAHVEAIFEQRVDAWMRRERRLRATFLPIVVTHPMEAGSNYPAAGLRERIRGRALRSLSRVLARVPHPATRAW